MKGHAGRVSLWLVFIRPCGIGQVITFPAPSPPPRVNADTSRQHLCTIDRSGWVECRVYLPPRVAYGRLDMNVSFYLYLVRSAPFILVGPIYREGKKNPYLIFPETWMNLTWPRRSAVSYHQAQI